MGPATWPWWWWRAVHAALSRWDAMVKVMSLVLGAAALLGGGGSALCLCQHLKQEEMLPGQNGGAPASNGMRKVPIL